MIKKSRNHSCCPFFFSSSHQVITTYDFQSQFYQLYPQLKVTLINLDFNAYTTTAKQIGSACFKTKKKRAELQFLWARYETLPFSSRHSTAPQMQLSFPLCLFLLSPPSFGLMLISCFELRPAFTPLPNWPSPHPPISMRAYLLFTAPRGYLSFSPLHCECHGDTRIPQSAGPDPPAAPP